jgi:hypothetical protein
MIVSRREWSVAPLVAHTIIFRHLAADYQHFHAGSRDFLTVFYYISFDVKYELQSANRNQS